jgi:hypothetical protein
LTKTVCFCCPRSDFCSLLLPKDFTDITFKVHSHMFLVYASPYPVCPSRHC